MSFIKRVKNCFIKTLFPVRCPYCLKVIEKDKYACEKCKSKFPETYRIEYAVGGYKCACVFPYDTIFKKAVLNFKFYNCGAYAEQLSVMLVKCIESEYKDESFDFITCVPMHKKQLRRRGYNHAELLAKECAKLTKIPYADALVKPKQNEPQHSLKASKRRKNVRGVYKATDKKLIEGKSLLIIDDIITTGNTLGECARILMKAGAKKVSCAALCSVNFS